MLWSLLVASFSVGSLAALCQTNLNNGCVASTITACESVCSLYKNQNSCLATSGCDWTATNYFGTLQYSCSATNRSIYCGGYSNETVCATNTMCSWQTTQCQLKPVCKVLNSSQSTICYSVEGMTAADCTNQNPNCGFKNECFNTDRCGLINDQTGCTGSAGCYWSTAQRTNGGISANASNCGLCFNDPSNTGNVYQTTVSYINQTCATTVSGFPVTLKYWSAVAASGCTGGALVNDGTTCPNNNGTTNNNSTNNNNTNTNNTNTNNTNTNNTNTNNTNSNNTNSNNTNSNNTNNNNTNTNNTNENSMNSAVTVGLSCTSVALLFLALSVQ